MGRWRRLGGWLTRALLGVALAVVVLIVAGLLTVQTDWSRDRLRDLIVGTANRYLTGTLEIGQLRGSLVRGIEIDDLRLSRDGRTIIAAERADITYNLRDLVSRSTLIGRVSLVKPHIVLSRLPDGRWDITDLVRKRPASGPSTPRLLRIDRIDVQQGDVTLRDPLSFGDVHLPSSFTGIDLDLAFSTGADGWTIDFGHVAFLGASPAFVLHNLSGTLSGGPAGVSFRALHIETPQTDLTLDGRIESGRTPTALDLHVAARRFAFLEWGGELHGLSNIAVESGIDARLTGPLSALHAVIQVRSTGGDVQGDVVLNTVVEGWHAKGTAHVSRFDLSRWLNRSDRPSDITGDVALDVDLHLGGRFPAGSFTFAGPHAAYLEYEADDLVARGTISATEVRIASFTATAYGSNMRLRPGSTISIDTPYGFHFVGAADGVDLRQVPRTIAVPHVQSTLALDFDVTGQFDQPFIRGGATFGDSVFLGARVAQGATGRIDTAATPLTYSGEGDLADVDLNHFGEALDVDWLRDPRWAGTVRGHFRVEGAGSGETMTLTGGGRLEEATLFAGRLTAADVSVDVRNGSLDATYDGALARIDPSLAMDDARYAAHLTGRLRGHMKVRDILTRSADLDDYSLEATLDARDSEVRGFEISRAEAQVAMESGSLRLERFAAYSPGVDLEATGTLELDQARSSRIDYRITRSDLEKVPQLASAGLTGAVTTSGTLTGPLDRLRFAGDGSVAGFEASGVLIPQAVASYDVTLTPDGPRGVTGTLTATADTVTAFGQHLTAVDARVTYDAGRVGVSTRGSIREGLPASLRGELIVDTSARQAQVLALTVDVRQTGWRLADGTRPRLMWGDTSVSVDRLELVDAASASQHLSAAGTWDSEGTGRLQIEAHNFSVDAMGPMEAGTSTYGGALDLTAVVTGTREHPAVSADFAVTSGRVQRVAFDRFAGHVDYAAELLQIDVRLDQSPGVFVTGVGSVPLSLFDRSLPEQPLNVAVKSTPISLTLIGGLTSVVRNLTGQVEIDCTILGTPSDPHFAGRVNVTDAGFEVSASGARYRNARMTLQLATDRIGVETLHVEDENRHTLDVTGSLATHELRVGNLQATATARGFEVLRNDFGRMSVDAQVDVSGRFESPRVTGRINVSSGSLRVDRILDQMLFQPYATEAARALQLDPVAALNPWDRMGLNVDLIIPGTLRMTGDSVQISQTTPLGLGNINLRVFGQLSLYKDPEQPLYVNGSLDSLTGGFAFQGRRFDVDPSSSVDFRGDLNPQMYVTFGRLISGVQTQVAIVGPITQPELRLTSVPPLDPSDVLSLIVFNTATNQLSAQQQQQLAVRAGTLAAGFIAAPMMNALERTLGLDTLEIEPGADYTSGTKVTVGDEIAPGLVARFSRQFGEGQYDEATLEYYLSRLFRIRGTFSDAGATMAQSPFRRIERTGVDLLLFFSF